MSHEIREGVTLKNIFWTDGEIEAGTRGCVSLTVRERCGEMARVPDMVEAVFEDGRRVLYNVRGLEGMTLSPAPEAPQD